MVAHVDPAKVEWARELNHRYPPDPDAATGLPEVLRTGRPQTVPEITEEMMLAGARDAEHLEIIRGLGLKSLMIVPLTARGRTLGAITFVAAESGRRYGPDDLAPAEELARRAGQAVDNARLYRESQEALRSARRNRGPPAPHRGAVAISGAGVRRPDPPARKAPPSWPRSFDLSRRLSPADAHAVWRYRDAAGRWRSRPAKGCRRNTGVRRSN